MKTSFFVSLAMVAVLFACDTASKDAVKDFIPGTYVRASQHEFGREYDTLLISLQNEAANEYKLTRKWRYERVLDGKTFEPEYKTTTTTAVYEPLGKMLKEQETGDSYSFDVEKKAMFSGSTKYEKIK